MRAGVYQQNVSLSLHLFISSLHLSSPFWPAALPVSLSEVENPSVALSMLESPPPAACDCVAMETSGGVTGGDVGILIVYFSFESQIVLA